MVTTFKRLRTTALDLGLMILPFSTIEPAGMYGLSLPLAVGSTGLLSSGNPSPYDLSLQLPLTQVDKG